MKKKRIILSIVVLLLISIAIKIIHKNTKKYVMYDGMMLAMTLTDNSGNTMNITEFPDGTNYTVEVDCGDTAIGRWLGEEWKLSVENIKGNVECDIDFYTRTDNDELMNIVQTAGTCSDANYTTKVRCEAGGGTWTTTITNANGYRYSGGVPNNYVWFNNELWRIIGLVPACTTATSGTCSATTDLVKIVRNDSIGELAYDAKASGHTGLWGSNTLYTLLNTYYYGKKDGTGTDYCYGNSYNNTAVTRCDYRRIGISNDNNDYYRKMIKDVYWYIGVGLVQTPSKSYTSEISLVSNSMSKIGLMNASDFGYSAIVSGYSTDMSNYNTAARTETNWLYAYDTEWTINQSPSNTYSVISIYDQGNLYLYLNANWSGSVRPVVYLDPNVYRISGTGTLLDPYIIGM